jgi:hypothetical protein
MKPLFLFLSLFVVIAGISQTVTIPEPEFSNRPYYLKGDKLEGLERTEVNYDTKFVAFGYGGSSSYYSALSPRSTVRFLQRSVPRFFIKIEGKFDIEDNPVVLSVGTIAKDRRQFKTNSTSSALFGGGKSRDISKTFVKCSLKKIRDDIYEIVLATPLEPGEYAFMPLAEANLTGAKPKMCCFAVD